MHCKVGSAVLCDPEYQQVMSGILNEARVEDNVSLTCHLVSYVLPSLLLQRRSGSAVDGLQQLSQVSNVAIRQLLHQNPAAVSS